MRGIIILSLLLILSVPVFAEANCGNNKCEAGENRVNCCLDCACSQGLDCVFNEARNKNECAISQITGNAWNSQSSSIKTFGFQGGLVLLGLLVVFIGFIAYRYRSTIMHFFGK